ncbi:hypothetical protein NE237_017018 [Protea cynaroides]|uniref:Uncharacterized protein n=1 Tax=Protea cynaroides TaxID=273540 RepID=A0A9Q0K788_9MAGN|nr:hypothetical protein NE237_017018 [Protea cynaroides]
MGVYKNLVGSDRFRFWFRFRRSSVSPQKTSSMGLQCNWVGAVRRRFTTKSSIQDKIIVFHHTNSETFTNELEEADKEVNKEQIIDSKEVSILDSKEVAVIVFHHTNISEAFTNKQEEEVKEKTNKEPIPDSKEAGDGSDGDDDEEFADASGDGISLSCELSANEETLAAIKIQTLFRGHLARRLYQALQSVVKLQTLVRGFNICVQVQ